MIHSKYAKAKDPSPKWKRPPKTEGPSAQKQNFVHRKFPFYYVNDHRTRNVFWHVQNFKIIYKVRKTTLEPSV
jgi:hypothetical protein